MVLCCMYSSKTFLLLAFTITIIRFMSIIEVHSFPVLQDIPSSQCIDHSLGGHLSVSFAFMQFLSHSDNTELQCDIDKSLAYEFFTLSLLLSHDPHRDPMYVCSLAFNSTRQPEIIINFLQMGKRTLLPSPEHSKSISNVDLEVRSYGFSLGQEVKLCTILKTILT